MGTRWQHQTSWGGHRLSGMVRILDRRVGKALVLLEAIGRYHDSEEAFALLRSCTGARTSGLVSMSTTLTEASDAGALTLSRISFLGILPNASIYGSSRTPSQKSLVGQDRGKSLSSSPRSLLSGAPPPGTLLPQSCSRSWGVALCPS